LSIGDLHFFRAIAHPMSTESLNIRSIFDRALEMASESERRIYLDQVGSEAPELRRQVEALLNAYDNAGSFLEAQADRGNRFVDTPIQERPGTAIGPYKLLEQIGEGGMGVVFMAEQSQPVQRKVALKVVKPGMDTKQVLARFDAERQALALMDHPNIARVLDAGTTESGRPYFVMELVRGVPVTDYCDQRRLSIRERLELFVTICQAVQHAHQKGIIHRDLKPTNVLVTLHDGRPIVKVIDFGVAKATGQKLTEKTLFTGFTQLIGTPLYMSPEQAELSGLDIDTRSDIYSLGVLLYELLTGHTPFDNDRLKAAAFDELRRIIREEDPPRPSTRISTLAQQDSSTISEKRSTDPRHLSRLFQGELDWIAMKSLEKDRNRRYESASALAADVERYLRDEPVEACPPSKMYRLRKFTRRNRAVLLTSSLVLAALVLGTGVSTWQAIRATRAKQFAKISEQQAKTSEQLALKNSRRADAISDFLINAFRSPDPSRDGRTVTIAEVLDRAVNDVKEEFADDQRMQADLLNAIAQSYQGLGLYRESVGLFAKVQELRTAAQGPLDTGTIESMSDLAEACERAGQLDNAIALYQDILKIQQGHLPPDDPELLATTSKLAWAYNMSGQAEKAVALFQDVLRLVKSNVKASGGVPVELPASDESVETGADQKPAVKLLVENTFEHLDDTGPNRKNVLVALNNLAKAFAEAGQVDKAIPLYQQTLKLMQEKLEPDDPMTLTCMYNLAMAYKVARRFEEAIPLFDETLRLRKKVFSADSLIVGRTMTCAGVTYGQAGHEDKCAELFCEVLRIFKLHYGDTHPETLWAMWQYGICLCDVGRQNDALQLWEKALPLSRVEPGIDHPTTLGLMRDLAATYRTLGRFDDAIPLYAEMLKLHQAVGGDNNPGTIFAMWELAAAYQGAGHMDDAIALIKAHLDHVTTENGPDDAATIATMWYLALAYKTAGRIDEEIATKEERLERVKRKSGPQSSDALNFINDLADTYQGAGRLDESSKLHEEYLQIRLATEGSDSVGAIAAKNRLAIVRVVQGRFAEAETLLSEDLPSVRNKLPADSGELSARLHHLAMALILQKKFAAAEPVARESLEIREKKNPDSWGRFHSESLLGGALLGEKQYADAEPRLVAGYEGMKRLEASAPLIKEFSMRHLLEQLVELYDSTDRPQEAANWKEKLTDYEKTNAQQPSVAKASN
jgi:eukaryotic-like serine/threonine-protein kinase